MYADMGQIVHDEGGLICPMFNDFVEASSTRISAWVDGVKGQILMNATAPLRMWVNE